MYIGYMVRLPDGTLIDDKEWQKQIEARAAYLTSESEAASTAAEARIKKHEEEKKKKEDEEIGLKLLKEGKEVGSAEWCRLANAKFKSGQMKYNYSEYLEFIKRCNPKKHQSLFKLTSIPKF